MLDNVIYEGNFYVSKKHRMLLAAEGIIHNVKVTIIHFFNKNMKLIFAQNFRTNLEQRPKSENL